MMNNRIIAIRATFQSRITLEQVSDTVGETPENSKSNQQTNCSKRLA